MGLTLFLVLTALAGLAGVANALSTRDRSAGRAGAGSAAFSGAISGILLFWLLAGALALAFLAISSA